jgi:methionine biosynthesis protein MetW
VSLATDPPRRSALVHEILGRSDYAIISDIVEPGSQVLDLGCGEAELLAWLSENKNVRARGVEINPGKVQKAIAKGVLVYQGDLETSLRDYPDLTFDYVILSQTLQQTVRPLQVLKEMLRVGRRAIVAFPNFGHWRVRWSHLVSGRSPRTSLFPYDWYNSPNIHFFTIDDFEDLVRSQHWKVDKRIFLRGPHKAGFVPNLMAEVAVYLFHQ